MVVACVGSRCEISVAAENALKASTNPTTERAAAAAADYQAPLDQVIYEEDEERAKVVLRDPAYQPARVFPSRRLAAARVGLPCVAPPDMWCDASQGTFVFIHRRTTKSGFSAIVVATLENIGTQRYVAWHSDTPLFFLHTQTLTGEPPPPPKNPFGPLIRGTVTEIRGAFGLQYGAGKFRMFAGQVDPGDSACFIIPLEIDGRRNLLVGELKDRKAAYPSDGYVVDFSVTGPDKPEPPTDILQPTDD
jgi:hypothetical protein